MSVAPTKLPVFDGAQEFINLLTTASHVTAIVFVESREGPGTEVTFFMHVKYEKTESYLDNI